MKYLLILLFLIPIYSLGQTKIQNKENLYFPSFTFDCSEEWDQNMNEIFSEMLSGNNKKRLFNDSSQFNFYRLLYEGKYRAIVEIFKLEEKYFINVDSCHGNTYHQSLRYTLSMDQSESIDSLVEKLWTYGSYEPCPDEPLLLLTDHRDNWVIEIKKGTQYTAINRIVPELEIIQFILTVMRLAKLEGYSIYYTNSEFKEY